MIPKLEGMPDRERAAQLMERQAFHIRDAGPYSNDKTHMLDTAKLYDLAAEALRLPPPATDVLEVALRLQEWQSALTGLCVGRWPKNADEAAANVRARLPKMGGR